MQHSLTNNNDCCVASCQSCINQTPNANNGTPHARGCPPARHKEEEEKYSHFRNLKEEGDKNETAKGTQKSYFCNAAASSLSESSAASLTTSSGTPFAMTP